jgi:hypothetical protein
LGHSDPRITQTIYTHIVSEDSRKVAAQLGDLVWGVLDADGRNKEKTGVSVLANSGLIN